MNWPDKIRNLVAFYTSTTSSRKNLNLLAETEPLRFVCDSLFYLYAEKSAREMVLDEREIKIFQFPSSRLFPVCLSYSITQQRSTSRHVPLERTWNVLYKKKKRQARKKSHFLFSANFFSSSFAFEIETWESLTISNKCWSYIKFLHKRLYIRKCMSLFITIATLYPP